MSIDDFFSYGDIFKSGKCVEPDADDGQWGCGARENLLRRTHDRLVAVERDGRDG